MSVFDKELEIRDKNKERLSPYKQLKPKSGKPYKNGSNKSLLKVKSKEELFAHEYVKHKFNGAKAYREVTDNKDISDKSASAMSSKLLTKKSIRDRIQELLPSEDKDIEVMKEAYNTKRPEQISWKDVHKFMETSLKLKGYLSDKPQTSVKIGLVVEK